MKNFFLITCLLTSLNTFGQVEFCKPNKVERASKRLVRKLSKEDYDSILKITKDSAVANLLFIAYESKKRDVKPITKYLIKRGLRTIYLNEVEEKILEYTYFKMHKIDTCMSDLLKPYIDDHFERVERRKRNVEADSINGIYIPKDLKECFISLDKIYPDSVKLEIAEMTEEEYSTGNHLFGIGISMRNNWSLWGGSRLSKYFNQLEIYHPDDMSGIIMDSYHRYLRNEDIKLEEQIRYYKAYWKEIKENPKAEEKWWKLKKNKN